MNLAALLEKIAGMFTTIATLKRQFDEQAKSLERQEQEIIQLRKENAELTTRVAVLEEGRKTIAADVKLAMTETLSQLEINRLKEELAAVKEKAKRQGDGRSLGANDDSPNSG